MLTEKQQTVLDKITEYISKFGKSPTIEELKNLLKQKSKRWVTQYLEALEKNDLSPDEVDLDQSHFEIQSDSKLL